jgi:oxalate decarboxylase/phosphoglucose isomerase-like protein (cupin superfamily)
VKKITPKVVFTDERGEIIDLIENENINAVTLLTIKKGKVRGNHYHKNTTQWNYIIAGVMKLVTQMPDESIVETLMYPGDLIATVPEEKHALVGEDDVVCLVLTKGPRGGSDYESDTFRLETPIYPPSKP